MFSAWRSCGVSRATISEPKNIAGSRATCSTRLEEARTPAFTEEDLANAFGGVHFILEQEGRIVSH